MRQANQEDPCPCHVKDLGFIFKVKDGIKCKPGSDFFGGGWMLNWGLWAKQDAGKPGKRLLGMWMRK